MEKLYDVAGTSTYNGVSKARFANGLDVRLKTLVKGGHTNIELITLPTPMTKKDAVAFLQDNLASYPAMDPIALENKAANFVVKAKKAAVKTAAPAKAVKTTIATKSALPMKTRSKKTAPAVQTAAEEAVA